LVTTLITVGCVVLAAIGLKVSEAADDFQVVRGRLGTPVAVNEGDVTVADPRVGNALLQDGEVTYRTAGMFVAVNVTVAAPDRDSLMLGSPRLLSGDRVYLPYTSLSSLSAVPGFQSSLDFVFEVDPNRIDALTLELGRGEIVAGHHQRVRVPLGVTRRNAEELRRAASQPIVDPQTSSRTRVIG
jgi:hypothetical protein